MPNQFAVLGNPIAHSLSPLIHETFAKQAGINLRYEKILVPKADFEEKVHNFFAAGGKGLNITLPFKERAFALAKVHTKRASQAKAANTLWIQGNLLHADNTDGIGLIRDLEKHCQLRHKTILIVGAGGAVRGILPALIEAHVKEITVTNRTSARALALAEEFPLIKISSGTDIPGTFDLIINATSAFYQQEQLKMPATLLHPQTICYDLNYKVGEDTSFVAWAKSQGVLGLDGLGMLIEQAAEAFYIWHGLHVETQYMRAKIIKS